MKTLLLLGILVAAPDAGNAPSWSTTDIFKITPVRKVYFTDSNAKAVVEINAELPDGGWGCRYGENGKKVEDHGKLCRAMCDALWRAYP